MDNEDIDPNICCMCFQLRHDDVLEGGRAQWIFFKCVEDGCMNTALKMLHQTMMDFNIFVFFALTNTLCEQYYLCAV